MSKMIRVALLGAALLLASVVNAQTPPAAKSAPAKKAVAFDASGCFGCHAPVKEFHDAGKHKGLACSSCHTGIDAHIANASARPKTIIDPANCGNCHKNQFQTMYKMNWEKSARKEK